MKKSLTNHAYAYRDKKTDLNRNIMRTSLTAIRHSIVEIESVFYYGFFFYGFTGVCGKGDAVL